jgi:hypothetical protein
MALNRRNLLGLFVADVVLFVIANVTAKNSSHPGTVSNVVWVLFLVGVLAFIVLCVIAVVHSMRSRRASA